MWQASIGFGTNFRSSTEPFVRGSPHVCTLFAHAARLVVVAVIAIPASAANIDRNRARAVLMAASVAAANRHPIVPSLTADKQKVALHAFRLTHVGPHIRAGDETNALA